MGRGESTSPQSKHLEQGTGKHQGDSSGVCRFTVDILSVLEKFQVTQQLFYPAVHQSEMEPGGSVWSLIQRENSSKPCRVCSPLGCDKWQGAMAVLRDDRAVLCIQTAPGGFISSDKWKALRNVSCPLKIHQEISLKHNIMGLLIPEFALKNMGFKWFESALQESHQNGLVINRHFSSYTREASFLSG